MRGQMESANTTNGTATPLSSRSSILRVGGGRGDHCHSRYPPTDHATDDRSLHNLRLAAFLLRGQDTGALLGEQSAAENLQARTEHINAVLAALGPWATRDRLRTPPSPPPPPGSSV